MANEENGIIYPVKLINVGETKIELNFGSFHYELEKGEMTPPLGAEMVNSFTARNPNLRIYNEEEGMLEDPKDKDIETFPSHQDSVDDPDRDEPKSASKAKGGKRK